ncbi:MAG: SMC-Scp complex subunit ScpB [Candidatus Nanopelagicales bacterium]|nr:SMC-Scp complex subunit ScpB [Candidatus Nanopelagicales bacterium]
MADAIDQEQGLHEDPAVAVQEELDDLGEAEELGAPSLAAAIEALLLLADEPMSVIDLAQATRQPAAEVEVTVRALAQEYDEAVRGFELREIAGGWRYYTRTECSPLVERYVLDGQQARLTQASLETLAVIAYRQPVTRGRVSAVRGVNVDGVIRTLVSRGLIEEAGHEPESAAILYRTTSTFLERLGIASLDELPPLAEHLPDLADLEDVLDSVAFGD